MSNQDITNPADEIRKEEKYSIPSLPLPYDLETKEVLKQLNRANRKLAELKGVAQTIPNERILISSLTLQEAKDSSEVENIVTTQDDLYRAGLDPSHQFINAATKEVLFYREAINEGFRMVRNKDILTLNDIKHVQEILEQNTAGFRTTPGTQLKRENDGAVIYTPPQDGMAIVRYMSNLEQFINDDHLSQLDPLIKMAIKLLSQVKEQKLMKKTGKVLSLVEQRLNAIINYG